MDVIASTASLYDGNGGQLGPAAPIILYAIHYRITGNGSTSNLKLGDDSGAAVFTLPKTDGASGVWRFPEGVYIAEGLWGDIGAETTICTIVYKTLS